MTWIATAIVALCAGLLLAWTLVERFRGRRWYSLATFVLSMAAYLGLLRALFGFPGPELADPKGADEEFLPLVLAMFSCMLLGMAAEYLYQRFDKPAAERRNLDAGEFVKPFLVSPLIFMPLAASLHGANVDLSRFDAPRLMLFLVAFENGFLWRGYFSRKLAGSGSQEKPAGGQA